MATERVGIEIEIMGYEEAMNQMKSLERAMKGLRGVKLRIQAANRLKELQRNATALRAELERLRAAQAGVAKGSSQWNDYARQMAQVRREMSQTAAEAQRLRNIMRNTSSVGQMFKKNTTAIAHLGSAMQSAGNAMQRFLAPWRLLAGGALLGAGFSAINKVSEGLTSGFSRYDTMKKFPKMMASLGYETKDAQKSINKLDQSVRGLPTGLDHMVDMTQRFALSLGDLNRGTDVAIATNNAFLASMSTEAQQYQGMMQLQDLLNGKKLNAREWMSLSSSMGAAVNEIAKVFGAKTQDDIKEFRQQLNAGKIDTEDFLDALIKVGTGEGKIAQMAQESKDTWMAFSQNVTNAFSRMAAGILQSLDEITQSAFGKDLNQLMSDELLGKIDAMTASVKKWIKANPDKIKDFFTDLSKIDFAGFARGFVKGLGDIAEVTQKIANKLDGKSLEGLGNFFSKLILLAPALTIGGGLLKGFRHVFGGIATGLQLLFGTLAGLNVAKAGGKVAGIVKIMKNLGKVGKMSTALAKVGGAAGAGAGAAGGAGLAASAKMFAPAIGTILGIGGVLTAITGVLSVNTWIIKKGVDNLKAITSGMQDVINNVNSMKSTSINKDNLNNAVGAMTDIYNALYGGKKQRKTATANKAGTGLLMGDGDKGFGDMSPRKLKKSANAIGEMVRMFSNISKTLDLAKKLVDSRSKGGVNMDTFKNLFGGESGIFAQFGGIAQDVDKYLGKDADIEGIADKMTQFKSIFDVVGQISKMIPTLTKTLSSSVGTQMGRGATPLTMLKQMLTGESGLFAVFGSIMTSMEMDMLGGSNNKRGNLKDISKFSEAMGQIKTMFSSLQKVIDMFPTLQASLGALQNQGSGRGSILGTVKQQVTQLFQDLGQMFTAFDANIGSFFNMDKIAADVGKAVTAVKSLGQIASQLSSLGTGEMATSDGAAFTAIQNIKTMVSQLGQALNTETLGQLQTQVDTFKAQVQSIFDTLNGDLANVEVVVTIKGRVEGVDALLSEIRSANSRIRSAVRSIQNSYTRYVYVHVVPQVSVGAMPNVSIPGASTDYPHTGGYISGHGILYRSKGGDVFGSIFMPKGTDTVPAMLTPGEYVQSKKAVDFFGVRFMQKLNNLDVRGAMRELSARVGQSSVMARGMTVYNNITNNNQTVNQHVNTNNPNFAFRRSRSVMAL